MAHLIEFLPVLLLAASIVCIPLLAGEMPGSKERAQRIARRRARLRAPRGTTVPYISMRQPHRDQ
ncbi:MAG: hypothetical protein AB7O50_00025 [Pseudolabrys sp.]